MGNIALPKINCPVIEINREATPLTNEVSDFIIQGSSGEILSIIEQKVKKRRRMAS
jgi:hypothetical protein